ncbi:hypothetical protein CSC94_08685 [Zhengella mangrovi]|uniref:Peptidase C14 caspase domain-containing protein n=1 Tax=Zhengella mangrovi TaxID=1982044 RepID=A0A2G1QQF7_9HYPH|nr:caspase family protein [Zhengella mangrovi]PHP67753.1 hypothetical protein CSC94_08685 [Zhengella mangrovi]
MVLQCALFRRPGATRRLAGLAVAAFMLAAAPKPVLAATRALLIGITDYQSEGIPDLRGPGNDVALMASALEARGIGDITTLTSTSSRPPTHAAILSAFNDLAAASKPGDLAVVFMSGHGTQQPDASGDEYDGLDEVFLPADAEARFGEDGTIPNALSDDEIGAAVDRIRATGADVWLIVDSCSSGTALRGGADGSVRARWVPPSAFGLAAATAWPQRTEPFEVSHPAPGWGAVEAFYAAQPGETAQELNYVAKSGGASDQTGWYGLMTAKLASRLADGGDYDFDTLFLSVFSDMNRERIPGLFRRQTPLKEGTMGRKPVPGTTAGSSDGAGLTFTISAGRIDGGLVQGLRAGDILALYREASLDADPVGHARVTRADPLSSLAEGIDPSCGAGPDPAACEGIGAIDPQALFARLARPGQDNAVSFAFDGPEDTAALVRAAAVLAGSRVRLAGSDADVAITAQSGTLLLARADATDIALDWPIPAGDDAERARALSAVLRRAARAVSVARLGMTIAGAKRRLSFRKDPDLTLTMQRARAPDPDTDPAAPGYDPAAECQALQRDLDGETAIGDGAWLKQCDRVALRVTNGSSDAYDINIIRLASDFSITVFHDRLEGRDKQGQPSLMERSWTVCSDCPERSSGPETLIAVMAPARTGHPPLDLSPLADDVRRPLRSASDLPVEAAFFEAADTADPTLRGLAPATARNVSVETYSWRVVARSALPPS